MLDLRLIYVNCPDRAVATAIARACVNERLAACANISPGVTAIYRWEGEMQEADEVVLILKTRESRLNACMDRATSLHPYAIPGIMVVPIINGHTPFLDWLVHETRPVRGT